MRKKDMVVIGNGIATTRLLESLLQRRATERFNLTVYGDEPGTAYGRHLLGNVLRGAPPSSIALKPEGWYGQHGVALRHGRVVRLDTARRKVFDAEDGVLHYDVAVLATGSVPKVPDVEGLHDHSGGLRRGVFVYRALDDCLGIRGHARAGDSAVVLGGGLLGLEAAKQLCDLGLHVTVVHLGHGLMNAQLDFVAGQMLQRQIEAAGVFVRTGRTLESVLGHDAVEGVVLDDGEHLPADLVVVACGVRPRVEVAQASAIPLNHGVLVNDGLATQAPGVYAIGECAEHQGRVYGMLGPAQEQADVLADILSGWDPRARYAGSKPFARLNVPGIEVAALGSVEPQLEHDELLQVLEPRRHTYRKLIVRERKLVGAALVGDTRAAPALLQTYVRGERLPEDPLEALRSASVPVTLRAVDPACTCHGVARDTLLRAISGAAADATNDAEGALGLCPKCRDELERHVGTHREARLRAVSA